MAFKIITVSSLIPRNGLDTLIQACALLKIDYKLTIAGSGPEEKYLKSLAKGLPIIFLGRVSNELVPSLLATSHLFIRPSRFEGFGTSFIEAMAAGVPVIGTPVGGITDFITDGVTGLLVQSNNPKQLCEKTVYLYENPKFRQKLIKNALNLVKEKYNWDTLAESVYKEMLKCQKTS